MRFYLLYGGLRERMDASDPSAPPRPDYLLKTDAGENGQVGTGLSGCLAQPMRAALERADTATLIRSVVRRPEDARPWQLGL